jgi:hypothetical protein
MKMLIILTTIIISGSACADDLYYQQHLNELMEDARIECTQLIGSVHTCSVVKVNDNTLGYMYEVSIAHYAQGLYNTTRQEYGEFPILLTSKD